MFSRIHGDGGARTQTDIRAAVDGLSGDGLVAKFGALWDKWDRPLRAGAAGPGHEVIVPDAATMAQRASQHAIYTPRRTLKSA